MVTPMPKQHSRAVAIIESQCRVECRGRNAKESTLSHHRPPAVLAASNSITEEVVKEQVGEVRVGVKGILDLAQEHTMRYRWRGFCGLVLFDIVYCCL
ncbi:hypothetical protein E2C01_047913 [Portunus trituberculatus]|uniref:Uncharacterized protein n=1 Tax=Portunus trituberculatus TaxID=210409 RepID=A0A5B7G953_PORTR|nr:hypothetical protein [Portunus trituberculatus]